MKNLKTFTLIIGLLFGIQVLFSQCQAGFTYVNNGNGNVSFTNTSTGTITFTQYDFGSGNNNYWTPNPTYNYTSPGTYYVCLTAGDSATGCYSTFCDSVVISSINNCNSFFTANFNSNNNISFANLSSGNITSYSWSFGDGNVSSSFQPNNTYTSNGSYNVCLTVNDSNSGCSNMFCDSVTILPPGNCNANFTYVDNGNGNYSFTNVSTGTYDFWYWNFGAGWGNQSYMDSFPSYNFPTNGNYIVCISISDSSSGCYSTFCDTINVTSIPNCNSTFYAYLDSVGPFDVIVVNNSTGNNLTYLWDFGDGVTSTQQFPQHTYSTQGNYYLCLTIGDGNGCVNMFCDSINASGINKQQGFTINIISPTATSIEENLEQVSGLNIYPNPFKDNLTIEFNLIEPTTIEIFVTNLLGNIVSQINNEPISIGNNKLKWNAKSLSNGIYLLHIKTNNSLQVKKLILNN